MITKKDLVIAILATFCLTSTLFMIIPTRSSSTREYDPWVDLNDDGHIEGKDVAWIAKLYDTSGTPINKTALLLELQSRVDALESGLTDLQARHPIVNSTSAYDSISTTSSVYTDIQNISVTINLHRISYILIFFTIEAYAHNNNKWIEMRAVIDGWRIAEPNSVILPSDTSSELGYPYSHQHRILQATHSFTFYYPILTEGKHSFNIQWRVYPDGQVDAHSRTLTVLAIPI